MYQLVAHIIAEKNSCSAKQRDCSASLVTLRLDPCCRRGDSYMTGIPSRDPILHVTHHGTESAIRCPQSPAPSPAVRNVCPVPAHSLPWPSPHSRRRRPAPVSSSATHATAHAVHCRTHAAYLCTTPRELWPLGHVHKATPHTTRPCVHEATPHTRALSASQRCVVHCGLYASPG